MMIYLDHAATTPLHPAVLTAMTDALEHLWGNPSSLHAAGSAARGAIEQARAQVAALVGADPAEVVFTSGGTEANNLALRGVTRALRGRGRHLVTTSIEHSAVLQTGQDLASQGYELTIVGVGARGVVDPEAIASALRPDTVLVSVMHANNEIGTLQPIEAIGRLCRERGVFFHTDAVQTAGKVPLDLRSQPIDLLSLSGHKLSGPKGTGALIVGCDVPLRSLLTGGSHERGLRAGTENVAGIVGLGLAAELAAKDLEAESKRLSPLGRRLREGLLARIPGATLNGDPEQRLSSNVSLSIPNVAGDALLLHLDLAGIAASAGSACRSHSKAPSHVLVAIGALTDESAGSLRLTLGRLTSAADVDEAIARIPAIVQELRDERTATRG